MSPRAPETSVAADLSATTDPSATTEPRSSHGSADPLRRAVRLLDVDLRRAALALLLGVLALGSAIALAAVSAWLIARASQMPPVMTLTVATVSVRMFGISRGLFRYLERLASHTVALRGMASLRTRIYAALAGGRLDAVAALRRGDLLARVGADVDAVGDVVVRAILPGAVAVVLGVGSVAFVGVFHLGAAAALAGCLVLSGIVGPWLAARGAATTERRTARARSDMAAVALEIVDDAAALTVSGNLRSRREALAEADGRLAAATDAGARTSGLAAGIGTLAVGLAVVATMLLAIPSVTAGTLGPVQLAVVVLTPLAVFEITQTLPAAAIQMHRSRQAAARIMALLDAATPEGDGAPDRDGPPEKDDVLDDIAEVDREPQAGIPAQRSTARSLTALSLTARDLACGWPGTAPVVAGLDLDLRPGRSVALVGPSGTGKTTTLLTLAGLVDPVGGSLTLDGRPVRTASHDTVAQHVVLTTEDAHVFSTTVLENLRVARGDVAEAQAVAALERAGLGEWLAGLPDGVLTTLGADGATISGGERRRLLLARALCSPATFLLVDEPAEHLDPATADQLVADLLRAGRGTDQPRGVVVATHRLSALAAADEVVLIDEGGVVARGTHASLLVTQATYRATVDGEHTTTTTRSPGATR
ncbi:cysteine export CydDC family ABC transporter permease subunit/ATP-binding protein CydC [Sanguibacter keddieii DSM 10542]|uniref:Cysteine export CydDC family ABC transporter permease subunit/ATP-binding protein CydC n=1 Tax=Sanguibacter keddieii (strain ATCC 51767 / DSM 10542 / NCFB 3025 / ST-74) TaxID=446469 RepID=D1BDL7_SANKS|nr:thiol reductant ABC exporter subunit CydC [Sanguibacter keddieii]ACZ21079.1 cysteine export CydDC family ABC transporter permease subunit/ATP-binding protein CydC [Sanguibacter keddieii DSM 10542]